MNIIFFIFVSVLETGSDENNASFDGKDRLLVFG